MLRRLTISNTAIIIVFILLFAMSLHAPTDMDMWWHLRGGSAILEDGIMYTDTFSHTYEGHPWVNYSWGSQVILYWAWQIAGNLGLVLYTSILALIGMIFLYPICRGNNYLRGFVLVLGAATAAVFWTPRPQMFSFVFSCMMLYLVYSAKQGRKERFWLLLPIMGIWGNLHAGYSIGYLFLIAFIVGELFNRIFGIEEATLSWAALRRLSLYTLVSVACLAISPYGIQNMLVPFQTVGIDPLRDFIQEWQSPNFQGREIYPFMAQIMLLLGLLWASRHKFDWSGFFLLIGSLYLALSFSRNIAVFAVVATPLLSHAAHNLLLERNWDIKARDIVSPAIGRLNLILIVAIGLAAFSYGIFILQSKTIENVQRAIFPIGASEYLNQHELPREMFNSYNWGGYLLFTAPDYRSFIDGRADIFTDFMYTYAKVAAAQENWREILMQYDIRLVVIERGSLLANALSEESAWALVYEDDVAAIYVLEDDNSE